MNRTEILEKIFSAVMEISGLETVEEESSFMDDLEMASMEIFVLLGELENKFSIKIPERMMKKIGTVGDLADVIQEIREKG